MNSSTIVIKNKDLALRQIDKQDLELIRYWRNHPSISSKMVYTKNISQEMQVEWFNNLTKNNSLYFTIIYKDNKIGLINLKDISFENKSGELGLFIWDKRYIPGPISFQSTFSLIDYAFDTLCLSVIYSTILIENKNAIRFNQAIGFENFKMKNEEVCLFKLNKTNYIKKSAKIKKIINRL